MRTAPHLSLSALLFLCACGDAAPGATTESEDATPESDASSEPDSDPDSDATPESDAALAPDAGPLVEPDAGEACDPATSSCRVTLTTRVDGNGGIDLESGEQTALPTDGSAPMGLESPVDLTLWLGRFLGISGTGLESICPVGEGFAALGAVPTDESDCTWSGNVLFGVLTNPFDDSTGPGQGLLVRDRLGEKLYKLLIVADGAEYEDLGGYTGWLTFDYTLVPR